jgi:Zn ribbon nucleic-acid-binding protein
MPKVECLNCGWSGNAKDPICHSIKVERLVFSPVCCPECNSLDVVNLDSDDMATIGIER